MLRELVRVGAVIAAPLLFMSCSEVPTLSSEPVNGNGPSVRQVVNHINCELASIIASNPSRKVATPFRYRGKIDPVIEEREAFDQGLRDLLPKLQENHFVASALLTLDTSDNEGLFPSVAFIHPFTTMNTSLTGTVGGQLSGSQERNLTVGYSIDLANVADGCFPWEVTGPQIGLNGSLRLGDIIADGLTGLDSTQNVNVYSSGGPTRPAFDATLSRMVLGLKCLSSPDVNNGCQSPYATTFNLTLSGVVNFAPASDPEAPGTISFSGKATDGKANFVMSLTGSAINVRLPPPVGSTIQRKPNVKFTLSGTMTREAPTRDSPASSSIGYNPSISLVGTIAYSGGRLPSVTGLKDVTGLVTPSSELGPPQARQGQTIPAGTKISYVISAPSLLPFIPSQLKINKNLTALNIQLNSPALSGGNNPGGSGTATAKSSAASSANSTQFGSLVTFAMTYGINGGPNWTLTTFKGPGGGTGSGGQLVAVGRTYTASLQLTFVPACNDTNNPQFITTFWDSIPKCNGTQQAQAALTGQALNYLAASGRTQ